MVLLYKLEGRTPVLITDIHALYRWTEWFETIDREVRRTILPTGEIIMTVFLGMDVGTDPDFPQLFETKFFQDGEPAGILFRCATWDEAEAAHKRGIRLMNKIHEGLERMSDGADILSRINFDTQD